MALSKYLKCKKIGLYLLSLNLTLNISDCWSWSYWSSQWGGNGSVENHWKWTKHEALLYEHYPPNRRQAFSISKANTYSEGISCAICCSLAAIQEVPTGQCHVALLISNISIDCISSRHWRIYNLWYQYKHVTVKVFPQLPILLSNCENFPTWKFCHIRYFC